MKAIFSLIFFITVLNCCAQEKPINLIDAVLNDLNINKTECLTEFILEQKISDYESIIFIPKIAEEDQEGMILDAILLIVSNATGKINSKFSEKECWYSDAVRLSNIQVTYNPYLIHRSSETIGILITYYGSSRVFPYSSTELTLFERKQDSINRVLVDYPIHTLNGDNDLNGKGDYVEIYKFIRPDIDYEMEFYDLIITDLKIETENHRGTERVIEKSENKEILKYDNGEYKNAL